MLSVANVFREALDAARSARFRCGAIVVFCSVCWAAAILADMTQVEEMIDTVESSKAGGANVVSVRKPAGIERKRCDSGGDLDGGLVGSGALRVLSTSNFARAPGDLFRIVGIDRGMIEILGLTALETADVSVPIAVGPQLAAELALEPGDALSLDGGARVTVTAIANRAAQMDSRAARWVFVIESASPVVDECWFQFVGYADDSEVAIAGAMFADVSEVQVTPVRPPPLPNQRPSFAQRSTRSAGLGAGALVWSFTWLLIWTMRGDIGLYRSLGLKPIEVALVGSAWVTALQSVAFAIATLTATGVSMYSSGSRPAAYWTAISGVGAWAAASLTANSLSWFLIGNSRDPISFLKDR